MFANINLPATVCYICLNSLTNAFQFVYGIEKAQTVINNYYSNYNIENIAHSEESTIKPESQDTNNLQSVAEDIKETKEPIKISNMADLTAQIFSVSTESHQDDVMHDPLDTEISEKTADSKAYVNAENIKDECIVNIKDPNFYLLLQPSVVYGYVIKSKERSLSLDPISCTDSYTDNENREATKDSINVENIEYPDCSASIEDSGLGKQDNNEDLCRDSNGDRRGRDSSKDDGDVGNKLKIYELININNTDLKENNENSEKEISFSIQKANKKKEYSKEQKKKRSNIKLKRSNAPSPTKGTWREYEWKCAFCNGLYSNSYEMTSHLIKVHSWCNIYSCTDCTKKNYRLDKFINHVKRHRHHLKYSCYKCFQQFASMVQCRNHTLEHSKAEFVCPGCCTIFKSAVELNKHSLIYYKGVASYDWRSETRSEFCCSKCDKTFNRKCDFVKHLARHQKKRTHICDKCGAGFLGQGPLNNHMANHTEERPFKCEICGSCFKTPTQLRAHVMTHDDKKLFICNDCGKGFNIKRKLVGHVTRMHMEISEKIPCEYCEKKFNDKRGLKRHLHLHTGDMPYPCEYCPKKFRDRGNYSKHLKRIHDKYLARKTYTERGTFPIDPVTGEVIIPDTTLVDEWKNKILTKRTPKGPKKKLKLINL